ncbi:DsbA family oxidoreductase [Maritalea sp.]|uniref:DsbA family oxidoreductase n=1 Tax=Maritalea sp. TaxID=2003361 RepID=UPI0039E2AC23
MHPIKIEYHSDILCIWAYIAQRRVEQLMSTFGNRIEITSYFCSVFPDAHGKIASQWENKGGFEGYNAHVLGVAKKFPHVEVHKNIWLGNAIPRTSAAPHLFVKAVQIIEEQETLEAEAPIHYHEKRSSQAAWELRKAFFAEARDISNWDTHRDIAKKLDIDYAQIERVIRSSEALARLEVDYNQRLTKDIKGSPTYLMNDGRQKLFGNVGYKLIEANVQEVMEGRNDDEASWC